MIIDENGPFRQELQAMLTAARMAVVADCGYGIEAATLAEETRPDVILAAVDEPVSRAIQTIEAVRTILPGTPVIAYAGAADFGLVRQVMHAGARDLLVRPLKPADVTGAVELALNGTLAGEASSVPVDTHPAGSIITVFGAKGGVGKTTIATNLAASIAKNTDSSVLIIDLDTRFGDVAIMLDVEPRVTVAQVAPGAAKFDRETFKSLLIRHESGVYVLPSPKHPTEWRGVDVEEVKELARFAARMFDYVILDTPGAYNEVVASALEVATQVLMVTSVDVASIKDTSFVLDVLEGQKFPPERLMLVVNHPNGANTIGSSEIGQLLLRPIFWEIPHALEMTLASQVGVPVVLAKPRSRAAANFAALAAQITGKAIAPRSESKNLLRRLIPAGSGN